MKNISQTVPFKVNLKSGADFFIRRGYYIHEEFDTELILFKPGSLFAATVKSISMQLELSVSDKETKITLQYGTWVLFDTGDLEKELSRLVAAINTNKHTLV